MTLENDIKNYNSNIEENIPSYGKGFTKLSYVSIICILFSLPIKIFKNNESNKNMNNSSIFIVNLLENIKLNKTTKVLKFLLEIIIYILNILYIGIFFSVPDDISSLSLYETPIYNIDIGNSVSSLGFIIIALNLFKNLVLQGKGWDSLLFGLIKGQQENYISAINFWNIVGIVYYFNSVKSNYDSYKESVQDESNISDVNTIIASDSSDDALTYLKTYLSSASKISIPASAGLYFILLEIIQEKKKIPNFNLISDKDSNIGSNTIQNSISNLTNIGGGKPFVGDQIWNNSDIWTN